MTSPADLRKLIEDIDGLMAKRTPGVWKADPKRLMVGNLFGPIMSYLVGNKASAEGMTVSLASERIADHELVAALVNAYETLREALMSEEPNSNSGGISFAFEKCGATLATRQQGSTIYLWCQHCSDVKDAPTDLPEKKWSADGFKTKEAK